MLGRIFTGLALATCFSLNCSAQGPAANACVQDLDALPGFLLENDTGAPDHLAQFGQKYFDDALTEAKSAALQIRGNASCAPVITKYLRAWRSGHLWVEDITAAPAAAPPEQSTKDAPAQHLTTAPTIEVLSTKTLRLTLKNFELYNRNALVALIKAHREELEAHPNWIVDVRGNGGGSDSSYEPLMPWLMPDGFANAGTAILATPANIEAWTRFCAYYFAAGDAECEKSLSDWIARMRKAAPGTYLAMDDGGAMSYGREEQLEPHRPSRVAILIDGRCASSCEQFALDARQSFSVKLIGQHTSGSLDYANVRPHDMPSGKRRLLYATTRSARIPDLMVDVAGVPPDIYLPVETGNDVKYDEVKRAQSWLEGGSLAPREAK